MLDQRELAEIERLLTQLIASWDSDSLDALNWALLEEEVMRNQKTRLANFNPHNEVEFRAPDPPSNIDEIRDRIMLPHEIWSKYEALKIETSRAGWEEQIQKEAEEKIVIDRTEALRLLDERIQQLQGLLPQLERNEQQLEGRANVLRSQERQLDEREQKQKDRAETLEKKKEELDALERLLQGRRNDMNLDDLLVQRRLSALREQIASFERFCAPGKRYEGSFQYGSGTGAISGRADVVFTENINGNKNAVSGTITLSWENAKITRHFDVAINTGEVTEFPVTGTIIDNNDKPTPRETFFQIHRLDVNAGRPRRSITTPQAGSFPRDFFYDIIQNERHISIRFTDGEIDFRVGNAPNTPKVPLNLSPVQ